MFPPLLTMLEMARPMLPNGPLRLVRSHFGQPSTQHDGDELRTGSKWPMAMSDSSCEDSDMATDQRVWWSQGDSNP